MASYEPCEGSGSVATEIRVMHSDSPRFFYLNGKNAGKCHICGRSFTLGRNVCITPRHKAS